MFFIIAIIILLHLIKIVLFKYLILEYNKIEKLFYFIKILNLDI